MEQINRILGSLEPGLRAEAAEPFRAEEDGKAYQVWKLQTNRGLRVLKKTTAMEQAVYEAFFSRESPAPKVYAFGCYEGEPYLLMEYFPGSSMSRCDHGRLIRTLDALMESQRKWWANTEYAHVGYGFDKSWPNRCRRLEYLGELKAAYQAYLDAFAAIPRTLCNDDMLPFNVLADENRAVILDWEYGGILPWPCALARFLAFGEEGDGLFQMSGADRQFALDYYYEGLIREMGISRSEFDRTMDLFFLKEYSEWVYCAALSGDYEMEYYKTYSVKARSLARKLGFLKEKEVEPCFD